MSNLKVFIGFIILSCLIFFQTLHFPFFIFDDGFHILQNSLISTDSFPNFLKPWTQSFTPLAYNYWQVVSFIFGIESSVPFRLFNILFHGFNSYLVFYIFKIFTRNHVHSNICIFAALIFLLHPSQIESVVWVSSAKVLISTTLILFSIISFLNRKVKDQFLSAQIFWFVSLLVKPVGILIPVVYVLVDKFHFKMTLKEVYLRYAHFLIILPVGIYFVYKNPSNLNYLNLTLPHQVLITIDSLIFYLKKGFLLEPYHFNYGRNFNFVLESFKDKDFQLLMGGYLILTISIISYLAYKKKTRAVAGAISLFIVVCITNSGIVPFSFQNISTVADRYLYLPLLFLCGGMLFITSKLTEKENLRKVVISVVLVTLTFNTLKTIPIWEKNSTVVESFHPSTKKKMFFLDPYFTALNSEKSFEKAFLTIDKMAKEDETSLPIIYERYNTLLNLGEINSLSREIQYFSNNTEKLMMSSNLSIMKLAQLALTINENRAAKRFIDSIRETDETKLEKSNLKVQYYNQVSHEIMNSYELLGWYNLEKGDKKKARSYYEQYLKLLKDPKEKIKYEEFLKYLK